MLHVVTEEVRGEDPGGLGDREENETKVNTKDETGTGERAEFRSRVEGREA